MEKERPSLAQKRGGEEEREPKQLRTARRECLALLLACLLPSSSQNADAGEKEGRKELREIDDEAFEEEVMKATLPVVLFFSASWCPPCRAMKPMMEKLQEEYEGKCHIVWIDVDQTGKDQPYRQKNTGRGIPYCVFFSRGKALYTCTGMQEKEYIRRGIENTIGQHNEQRPKNDRPRFVP